MKKAKYYISTVDGPKLVDGFIERIDGFWYGFKKYGAQDDINWCCTELLTGMLVNQNHCFKTRKSAAEHCRTVSDKVQEMITSGKNRFKDVRDRIHDEYDKSDDADGAEMYRRLYGDWMN